jgi:hypothetical protein
MNRKIKFPVGTRVVRWGASRNGIAVPTSSIRQYKTAPIAQRRRGEKS